MACATNSLPVPVSPWSRTVESVGATIATCSRTFCRAGLLPTMPSKPVLRADFWFEMELLVSEPAHFDKACCCEVSEVCEINSRAPHNFLLNLYACFALRTLIRTK